MHLVCPTRRSAAARMAQLSIVDALYLAVAQITPQLPKRTFVVRSLPSGHNGHPGGLQGDA